MFRIIISICFQFTINTHVEHKKQFFSALFKEQKHFTSSFKKHKQEKYLCWAYVQFTSFHSFLSHFLIHSSFNIYVSRRLCFCKRKKKIRFWFECQRMSNRKKAWTKHIQIEKTTFEFIKSFRCDFFFTFFYEDFCKTQN